MSPDRKFQSDYFVLDGRHVASVLNARGIRESGIDSANYLVAVKVGSCPCATRSASTNTKKVRRRKTAVRTDSQFSSRVVLLLSERNHLQLYIIARRNVISSSPHTAATDIIGFHQCRKKYGTMKDVELQRRECILPTSQPCDRSCAGWNRYR